MTGRVTECSISEGRRIADQYPMASSGRCCEAEANPFPNDYVCTRPAGHDGPHVAHVLDGSACAQHARAGRARDWRMR